MCHTLLPRRGTSPGVTCRYIFPCNYFVPPTHTSLPGHVPTCASANHLCPSERLSFCCRPQQCTTPPCQWFQSPVANAQPRNRHHPPWTRANTAPTLASASTFPAPKTFGTQLRRHPVALLWALVVAWYAYGGSHPPSSLFVNTPGSWLWRGRWHSPRPIPVPLLPPPPALWRGRRLRGMLLLVCCTAPICTLSGRRVLATALALVLACA